MDTIKSILAHFKEAKKQIAEAERRQLAVWEGRDNLSDLPLLLMADTSLAHTKILTRSNHKEIHNDPEKMFINGLLDALSALSGGADAVPSIRANMGCSIFPSLLGVHPLLFEDKMPWVKSHLTREQISSLTPNDITVTDEFATALDHMSYINAQLAGNPIRTYPLDLQGPFDTAHIVYGDAIFYDLYDDPAFVHHLMDLCCHARGETTP